MDALAPSFVRRAERAYAVGRAGWSARALPYIVGCGLLAAWAGGQLQVLAAGVALAASFVLLARWRGGAIAAGSTSGLWAGALPFVAPLLAKPLGHACTGSWCFSWCVVACGVGGALAVMVIARRATHERQGSAAYWLSAGAVTGVIGALGCACAGFMGIAATAAAMLVVGLPTFAVLRLRPAA